MAEPKKAPPKKAPEPKKATEKPTCPGCGVDLAPRNLLCAECWSRVPAELQECVEEAWITNAKSPELRRAIGRAVRSLPTNRNRLDFDHREKEAP